MDGLRVFLYGNGNGNVELSEISILLKIKLNELYF